MLDDQPDRRQTSLSLSSYARGQTAFGRRPADAIAGRSAARMLNKQAYAPGVLAFDIAIIALAGLLAGAAYDLAAYGRVEVLSNLLRCSFAVSALYYGMARFKAARWPFGASPAAERARDGLSLWTASFILFLLIALVLKTGVALPRGELLAFFAFGAAAVSLSRAGGPSLLARAMDRRALAARNAIVIGPQSDPMLFRLVSELRKTALRPPQIVMFDDGCALAAWKDELRRAVERTLKYAHGAGPAEILVVGGKLSPGKLSSLLEGLAEIPSSVCLVPDGFTADCLRRKIAAVGESAAVEVQSAPLDLQQRVIKRMFDILFSAAAMLFLLPLLITIAAAIKLDSPGPILFRQKRTGRYGRTFAILKFRTMSVLEDGASVAQARRDDPRTTRVGQWLRRTSFDELPQLLNVFMGQMSLIGPRPHAVAHDRLYGGQIRNYELRQYVKPGISGWAQVNGHRGATTTIEAMRRRVEHDLWYVRHYSLFLDIEIMARTLFEVVRQRNAY